MLENDSATVFAISSVSVMILLNIFTCPREMDFDCPLICSTISHSFVFEVHESLLESIKVVRIAKIGLDDGRTLICFKNVQRYIIAVLRPSLNKGFLSFV